MIDFLSKPWPWFVAGPVIALLMFVLIFFGKRFGMSSNLRTICAIGGAGKYADFFKFDWKASRWNLSFVLGSILGGVIAYQFLTPDTSIALSEATVDRLSALGFTNIGATYLPDEIFGSAKLSSFSGLAVLLLGGFLVGFGARYAGGCTSGHAISGLSNLQWPSLIAVVGFFIGGLLMTHVFIPILFS